MDGGMMAPPPPPPAMEMEMEMEEAPAPPPPPPMEMEDAPAPPPPMEMEEAPMEEAPAMAEDEYAGAGAEMVYDDAADTAMAGAGMAAGGPGVPVMHGTYDRPDEEEEVMVKTEFVWADGAEYDVKLSGSWNGWMPVQMYHEGGGMWSVVTPVPTGTHEFKFVVDGEWRHSTRHPTVGDDEETMNNIRVIRGPPKQNQQQQQQGGQQKAGGAEDKKGCCVVS